MTQRWTENESYPPAMLGLVLMILLGYALILFLIAVIWIAWSLV
jgi:hypothetical protein